MNATLSRILDSCQIQMTDTLRELLRIPSVNAERSGTSPFGQPVQESLDYVLSLGRAKGFSCVNFDNYACELNLPPAAGSASENEAEAIGIVSHLDVVPAGSGWSYPPFGGKMADGIIYGRGAVDDKGPLVAAFYACLAIKESGLPLSRMIKHIIGTSEEGGSFPCIEYYKAHAIVPSAGIVPDSWFPVVYAEKGFLSFELYKEIKNSHAFFIELVSLEGGEALNVVAADAKAEFRITDDPPRLSARHCLSMHANRTRKKSGCRSNALKKVCL